MPRIFARDELKINSSIEEVWKVLIDIQNYPKWWPKVVNLKILKYNPEIIGTEFRANPLGGKSFACRVISTILNKEIQLEYFDGIYKGIGYWKIEENEGIVKVGYSVDLVIVDESIAFLSKIISIPKLHSMIFNRILNNLEKELKVKR